MPLYISPLYKYLPPKKKETPHIGCLQSKSYGAWAPIIHLFTNVKLWISLFIFRLFHNLTVYHNETNCSSHFFTVRHISQVFHTFSWCFINCEKLFFTLFHKTVNNPLFHNFTLSLWEMFLTVLFCE